MSPKLLLSCTLVLLLCRPSWQQESHSGELCLNLTSSPRLQKFVDALPIIPEIYLAHFFLSPVFRHRDVSFLQKLHRDLPPTPMYAFGTCERTATYPGPTLIAEQNQPATIRWENHILDSKHLLPLDQTLDWANPDSGLVPTVVHLHGAEAEAPSDGHPQPAAGSDAVVPRSHLRHHQDQHGLVGAYIIRSQSTEPSWVPSGYHLLVVQDKSFYHDGYIKYPDVGINPAVHPQWCPEYLGDVVLVNGKAWPHLSVAPQLQRFRLLNAGNSRVYELSLSSPVELQHIRIAPAERVDFLIDFSLASFGQQIELTNTGPAPFPDGPRSRQPVMLFRVLLPPQHERARIPVPVITPRRLNELSTLQLIREISGRDLTGVDWETTYHRAFFQASQPAASGEADLLDASAQWRDPVTETVSVYSDEVWSMVNLIPAVHLIHLHLVSFLVLETQPFNATRYRLGTCSFDYDYPEASSCYTSYPQRPYVDQLGLKDTAIALPFHVTRLFVQFRPNLLPQYRINPSRYPGYVWHCHMAEHEDNGMMRPLHISLDSVAASLRRRNDSRPLGDCRNHYH